MPPGRSLRSASATVASSRVGGAPLAPAPLRVRSATAGGARLCRGDSFVHPSRTNAQTRGGQAGNQRVFVDAVLPQQHGGGTVPAPAADARTVAATAASESGAVGNQGLAAKTYTSVGWVFSNAAATATSVAASAATAAASGATAVGAQFVNRGGHVKVATGGMLAAAAAAGPGLTAAMTPVAAPSLFTSGLIYMGVLASPPTALALAGAALFSGAMAFTATASVVATKEIKDAATDVFLGAVLPQQHGDGTVPAPAADARTVAATAASEVGAVGIAAFASGASGAREAARRAAPLVVPQMIDAFASGGAAAAREAAVRGAGAVRDAAVSGATSRATASLRGALAPARNRALPWSSSARQE